MTRLTNAMRDSLLEKLLNASFFEQAQSCLDMQADFVRRVYEDALADDLPLLETMPKDWLYTTTSFKVTLANSEADLRCNFGLNWTLPHHFDQAGASRELQSFALPYGRRHGSLKVYDAKHPLAREYFRLRSEQADLVRKIDQAAKYATAVMKAVTTVEKLIQRWSAVATFAKEYLE